MIGEQSKPKRPPRPETTKDTALLCAAAARSKKGYDLAVLEVVPAYRLRGLLRIGQRPLHPPGRGHRRRGAPGAEKGRG